MCKMWILFAKFRTTWTENNEVKRRLIMNQSLMKTIMIAVTIPILL